MAFPESGSAHFTRCHRWVSGNVLHVPFCTSRLCLTRCRYPTVLRVLSRLSYLRDSDNVNVKLPETKVLVSTGGRERVEMALRQEMKNG